MDKYNERLIDAKAGVDAVLKILGGVLVILVGIAVSLIFGAFGIGFLLIVGGIVLIGYFKDGFNCEYEFILTNGDIEIAKIIGKKRRKEVCTIEASSISRMESMDNDRVKNDLSIGKYKAKYYIGKDQDSDGRQVVIYSGEGDNQKLYVLDFDDKCIDHMNQVLKAKSGVKL